MKMFGSLSAVRVKCVGRGTVAYLTIHSFKFKRHKYLNFKVDLTYNISKFNEPWIHVQFYSLLPDQTGIAGTIIKYY